MGSLKRKTPEEPSTTTSQIQHDCVHEVSYPHGYVQASTSVYDSSQTKEPAKKFPFTLDPFQSQAITCLENSESVMVIKINTPDLIDFYYH
jgi:ATP-dependent RNA helicase DOB1